MTNLSWIWCKLTEVEFWTQKKTESQVIGASRAKIAEVLLSLGEIPDFVNVVAKPVDF